MVYNENSLKIYVAAHKVFVMPTDNPIYQPIALGKLSGAENDLPTGWITDRSSDPQRTLSDKNDRYNELTAWYWIWKNSEAEIVGLCHYRRFFVSFMGKLQNVLFGKVSGIIDEGYINNMLRDHDLILHNRTFFMTSSRNQLASGIVNGNIVKKEYVLLLDEAVKSVHPEDYDLFSCILSSKSAHLLNVMITRKEVADSYCEWLFPILFEYERLLEERFPKGDFRRMTGLAAERLLDVWVRKKHLRVKECLMINTEQRNLCFWAK